MGAGDARGGRRLGMVGRRVYHGLPRRRPRRSSCGRAAAGRGGGGSAVVAIVVTNTLQQLAAYIAPRSRGSEPHTAPLQSR